MLAVLLNVPQSQNDWDHWGFHHALDHQDIQQAILSQRNIALTQYILQPISQVDQTDFLQRNQITHNEMNGALNINSSDLQDVDFREENQLVSWINLHYQEHQNARAALQI